MFYRRKKRPSKKNGQDNLKIWGNKENINGFIFQEPWRKNIQMPGKNGA